MESLQKLAYRKCVEILGIYAHQAQKDKTYCYIEETGICTHLGKLLNITYADGGNWHDGFTEYYELEFENKKEHGDNKISSSSYLGQARPLPIIETG